VLYADADTARAMIETQSISQLEMVWPHTMLTTPPAVIVPDGYTLRMYQPGDEPAFCRIMDAVGFGVWDDERLQSCITRILPDSWFMVIHDNEIVATAMGIHSHTPEHPFGGELGWVAAVPTHQGRGLGITVCAAVTARLIGMGYQNIHLYTEDYRLPALKTYLRLGYVPYLYLPAMYERWKVVCTAVNMPFTPERWRLS
jgi:mycothiol synthase